MNHNSNLFQVFRPLIDDSVSEEQNYKYWYTATALMAVAGLPLTKKQLASLVTAPQYLWSTDPGLTLASRLIYHYSVLIRHGGKIPFCMDADKLAKLVRFLDPVPHHGYYDEQMLRQDCGFVMSGGNINEASHIMQLLHPLITWRTNRWKISWDSIGIALMLMIIHRLIRENGRFGDFDFLPMINVLMVCNTECIPNTICSLLNSTIEGFKKEKNLEVQSDRTGLGQTLEDSQAGQALCLA